jgi:hypothetical protein
MIISRSAAATDAIARLGRHRSLSEVSVLIHHRAGIVWPHSNCRRARDSGWQMTGLVEVPRSGADRSPGTNGISDIWLQHRSASWSIQGQLDR